MDDLKEKVCAIKENVGWKYEMKSRRTGYWTAIILIVSLVLMVFSMFASTDYAMRDQSITRHFSCLDWECYYG